jgi:hypothetical protein
MADGVLGTEFEAMHDPLSPEEVSRMKSTATRRYLGPWDGRWEFAQKAIGRVVTSPGPPVTIYYEDPYRYPGADWLYAARASMAGYGASLDIGGGELAYEYAEVTLHFESINYDTGGAEPYLEVNLRGSDENLTIESAFRFASGQVVPGPVGIPMPRIDFAITAHKLPGIRPAWFTLVGAVNNAVWRDMAIGTVLFQPSEVRVQRNSFGEVQYMGNFNFSFRWVPWNYALNPYTGLFEAIETIVGGNPPVRSGNFNLIFD